MKFLRKLLLFGIPIIVSSPNINAVKTELTSTPTCSVRQSSRKFVFGRKTPNEGVQKFKMDRSRPPRDKTTQASDGPKITYLDSIPSEPMGGWGTEPVLIPPITESFPSREQKSHCIPIDVDTQGSMGPKELPPEWKAHSGSSSEEILEVASGSTVDTQCRRLPISTSSDFDDPTLRTREPMGEDMDDATMRMDKEEQQESVAYWSAFRKQLCSKSKTEVYYRNPLTSDVETFVVDQVLLPALEYGYHYELREHPISSDNWELTFATTPMIVKPGTREPLGISLPSPAELFPCRHYIIVQSSDSADPALIAPTPCPPHTAYDAFFMTNDPPPIDECFEAE